MTHLLWAVGLALASLAAAALNLHEGNYAWAAGAVGIGAVAVAVVCVGWRLEVRTLKRRRRPTEWYREHGRCGAFSQIPKYDGGSVLWCGVHDRPLASCAILAYGFDEDDS